MFNGAWPGQASLKTSVLAASIIDSGSSFHSWGKSFIHIIGGPATSIYKFLNLKVGGHFLFGVPSV